VLKSGAFEDDWTEPAVVAALERDVIGGIVEPEPKKSRAWIWVVIVSLVLGAVVAALLVTRNAPPRGSVQAQQPAGEEPITPATGASDDEAAVSAAPGSPSPNSPAPVTASPGTASPGTVPPAASNPGATSRPGIASDDALPFRVHVASFRTESKVDEVVQVLRRRNLDAWFEPPPKGGTWYRIYVGHFATEKEARDYAAWLLKNGFVESAQTYPQTER
jgi:septal ring-binding cell division protein DamX